MNPSSISHPVPQLDDPACRLSLDGDWRCLRGSFHGGNETGLTAVETDDRDWETVVQPGKVFYADPEADGSETPGWNRVTLEHLDPLDGAILRRRVMIPKAWSGRRIRLRFDAVYPAGRFYINGQGLGEHLSGLTPVEFDVTDRVVPGAEAVIAVRLLRRHPFVRLDMPRHAMEFAGLAQPATLFAVEACHIRDTHLISSYDPRKCRGEIAGSVLLAHQGSGTRAIRLRVAVTAPDGALAGETAVGASLEPGAERAVPVHIRLDHPLPWNDEYPHLYPVRLTLEADGQPPQTVCYRTGFRHLALTSDGAFLNGNPVKFRGVNHLTFHPEHGMHTPKDWLASNLTLMKRANVNAIRTHFLGPCALSDLCDEMGIYLLQELPADWGTDTIHDPEWVEPVLQRIESAVRRDRHHPSLMVWSVGNENMPKTSDVADAGWRHLRQFDACVKRLDPSRPTMFPPPGPANAIDGIIELRVGDIADTHYSFRHIRRFLKDGVVENPNSWAGDMRTLTREEALARGWSGTWFSSEYGIFNALPDLLYSPYGSIISDTPEDPLGEKSALQAFEERLRREWGLMRDDPTCLGGAYFPWLCAGASRGADGNPWGWVRWGEDADWGVVTADLLPKPFFWALRVLFSPVWFPRRLEWRPGQPDIVFSVKNQFNAVNLRDCTLRVQQNGGGDYMTMMRTFRDVPVSGAPGQSCDIRIPLEPSAQSALENGTYALIRHTLLDPRGFRVLTAETLVLPPDTRAGGVNRAVTIGPDAVMDTNP